MSQRGSLAYSIIKLWALIVAFIATWVLVIRMLWIYLSIIGIGMACLTVVELWRARGRWRYMLHRWRVWVGRRTVLPFRWHVLKQTECAICCHWIKRTQTVCSHCGFDWVDYQRAEARCWIRDNVAGLTRVQRSHWVYANQRQLRAALKLLEQPWEESVTKIVETGWVPGSRHNHSVSGPPA